MNEFLFAQSQMALSLAFHIIFAAFGIGMPLLLVVISEELYLSKRYEYLANPLLTFTKNKI
jgi:cytochrome d ubiquinol oxidase subunit I